MRNSKSLVLIFLKKLVFIDSTIINLKIQETQNSIERYLKF